MKFLSLLNKAIRGIIFYIGIFSITWGVIGCLSGHLYKGVLICIGISIVCFGYVWLTEKIRRHRLSPEERKREDLNNRKNEEIIDKARYQSSIYNNNSLLVEYARKDYTNKINEFVYSKMDEMIEEAEDPNTKIMLLKKKNKMLKEDLEKLNNDSIGPH